MSRKISYKGKIPVGEQERINLSTIDGKTGYKITKFQIISTLPGDSGGGAPGTYEYIAQIFKKDQTGKISTTIDFTNSELLAAIYYQDSASAGDNQADTIIFDNEKFNQDIFITLTDAASGTTPANYYLELEAMDLSDLEATMLTLKNIRTINS
tara:strand:- start:397 stop:858 length:462 start_codon:yes stop_codon:yes gene_type:complete